MISCDSKQTPSTRRRITYSARAAQVEELHFELGLPELVLTFFEIELRKSIVAVVGSRAFALAMPEVAAAGLVQVELELDKLGSTSVGAELPELRRGSVRLSLVES